MGGPTPTLDRKGWSSLFILIQEMEDEGKITREEVRSREFQTPLTKEQTVGWCGVSLPSSRAKSEPQPRCKRHKLPALVHPPLRLIDFCITQVGILDDLCVAEDPRLIQAYTDHTRGETFFLLVLPLLSKNASSSSWLSELQNVGSRSGTTAPSTKSPQAKTVSFTPATAPPVRP